MPKRASVEQRNIGTLGSLNLIDAPQGFLLMRLREIEVAPFVQRKIARLPIGRKQLTCLAQKRNAKSRKGNIDRAAKLLPYRAG
jgi:hypothetical protein